MAFSIGRAGLTLTLPEPLNWQNSGGGTVTLTGTFLVSGSVTDSLRLRDQLLGYAGNFDELIVPVISGAQPRDTGYYRVVSVDIPTTAESLLSGIHAYSIVLQPVPGYAQPQFESIITGGLLNNVVGAVIGDTQPFHAVPNVVTEYFKGTGGTVYSRLGPDGYQRTGVGEGTISDTARFYVAPSSFYVGASGLEQGSPLQPVIGRQLAQNDMANWRLSNGLVRVVPSSFGAFTVSGYNGSVWSTPKGYYLNGGTGGIVYVGSGNVITVLRNSPEEVVIRIGAARSTPAQPRVFVDLALRRGDRLLRGYLAADVGEVFSLRLSAIEAMTAITYGAVTLGGIRATANDADTNRCVMLSYQQATTSDLVNGRLTSNASVTSMDFAIGLAMPGTVGAPDDPVSLAKQYVAAQTEKQQTVAR